MAIFNTAARALPLNIPVPPPLDFNPPKGERVVLGNGMVVYLLSDPSLPAVRITAVVRTGNVYNPAGKEGLGSMTAGMLEDGGSASYKPEEIDKTLEYLGASLVSSMGTEDASVSMFALSKDLDKVLDIYADVLMRPAFAADKFDILKKGELEVIRRRNDDPGKEISREAVRYYFGKDHPYGRRTETASIESITIDDMKAFHSAYYRPNNVILAVSGSYGTDKEMLARLEAKFGGWQRAEVSFPVIPEPQIVTEKKIYFIEKDVPQAYIMIVNKGMTKTDPIEFPFEVTNDVIGASSLSSRLWDTVRARKGLAYSVYSTYSRRNAWPGYVYAYCGTKPETYSQALEEILRQLKRAKTEALSAGELEDSKGAKINSFVFRFKTPYDLVFQRALLEHFNFPTDYLENYVKNISAVTRESALAAAAKLYDPDNALIFVIGNSKKFDRPLSDFGAVTELKED